MKNLQRLIEAIAFSKSVWHAISHHLSSAEGKLSWGQTTEEKGWQD